MSSIVTTEGIVHYEMDGRGQPVVLLHGWINSWAVWRETMIYLAEQRRFKVYALDTKLGLDSSAKKEDVEEAMGGHVLAKGELVGKYARQ